MVYPFFVLFVFCMLSCFVVSKGLRNHKARSIRHGLYCFADRTRSLIITTFILPPHFYLVFYKSIQGFIVYYPFVNTFVL